MSSEKNTACNKFLDQAESSEQERRSIVQIKKPNEEIPDQDKEKSKEKRNAIGFGITFIVTLILFAATITYAVHYKKMEDAKHKDKFGNPLKERIVGLYYGLEPVSFKKCFEYKTENNTATRLFYKQYINFLVNNKTGQVEDFAILDGRDFGNKHLGMHIYDLHTGDLVLYQFLSHDVLEPEWFPEKYYKYLKDSYTWIPIEEAGQYMDGGLEIKDTYTIDEITEISNKVKEGFELIKSSGQLVLR